MRSISRRRFAYGTGTVLGSAMFGCRGLDQAALDTDTTVFVNGTVLPVDAAFSDHEIGSLGPGKLADLVVVEDDPRKVEPTAISDIAVIETWMDGRRVFGSS